MGTSKTRLPEILFVIFVLILLIATSIIFFSYYLRMPQISDLSFSATSDGGILIIRGKNFGGSDSGRVYIMEQMITRSHYQLWSEREIHLLVSARTPKGLVMVETERGKSNVRLFAEDAQSASRGSSSIQPEIISVEPTEVFVGDRLRIKGENFGMIPHNAMIEFSHQRRKDIWIPADMTNIIWSDVEIIVRIPDGAAHSLMRLRTERGTVLNEDLNIRSRGGNKIYGDGYEVVLRQDVSVTYLQVPDLLRLWLPHPEHLAAQALVEIVEEDRNMRTEFSPTLIPAGPTPIQRVLRIFRFAEYTDITPADLSLDYDIDEVKEYLNTEDFFLTFPRSLRNFAQAVVQRERNPYRKAETVFRALIQRMEVSEKAPSFTTTVLEDVFADKKGDSFDYAALYVSCLRLLGIPARLVTGVLLMEDGTTPHVWSEFYLDDFGWVPVDPALADGMYSALSTGFFRDRLRYFGNIDGRHISFRNNEELLSMIDPTSQKIYQHSPDYTMQRIQGYFHGSSRFIITYKPLVLIRYATID